MSEVAKIIIPSMGRWDAVTTTNFLPTAAICVPESQQGLYVQHNDAEVIAHPDNIIGMAMKRQWMLEKFGNIFMVDDDMKGMKRNYISPGVSEPEMETWCSASEAYDLIQTLADTARQMGVKLFGYTYIKNPMYYQPQKPFNLTGIINGGSMGMLSPTKLSFEDCYGYLNEDDFISLLNKYYHRMALIDNRYSFIEAQQAKGGYVGHKTDDNNEKALNLLREKFGSAQVDTMYGGRKKYGR